jgi:hypothetical protein
MDFLKAELERKKKLRAEEFGGKKYVKKSEITAVREGKLRAEEEAAWIAKHGGSGKKADAEAGALGTTI